MRKTRPADFDTVIVMAVAIGGLGIGFLAGRWWIALGPASFGAWVAAASHVDEVPPWLLGLAYAGVGVASALAGVVVRRRAQRARELGRPG